MAFRLTQHLWLALEGMSDVFMADNAHVGTVFAVISVLCTCSSDSSNSTIYCGVGSFEPDPIFAVMYSRDLSVSTLVSNFPALKSVGGSIVSLEAGTLWSLTHVGKNIHLSVNMADRTIRCLLLCPVT
jgi:hypothetical protein